MMNFLITRPEHDDTVFYLSVWSKELIERAKQKGFGILDCKGPKANQSTVTAMLTEKKPELILFNGHGSKDAVFGHKEEVLVEKDKSEESIRGAIVFARTCQSAAGLGESAVKKGTKAFIGYEDDFAFWSDNSKSLTPLRDEFAKPFFKASNQVIYSLFGGSTAEEANKRSQGVFDEEMKKLLGSNAPPEAQYILPLLFWDKINQVVKGNEQAKL